MNFRRLAFLAALLGAGLTLASAGSTLEGRDSAGQARGGPERDPKKLRPGVFLYAVPEMGDPNFAETVVLLVSHDKAGAMGFVVNRPTSEPRLLVEAFVTTSAVIATFWLAWAVYWLIEQRW